MGVVAQLFGMLGTGISGSRATLTMNGRMRGIAQQLRLDLAGITAKTLPPLRPENGLGYFELIEGIRSEPTTGTSLTGDCDDILMFTTKSSGDPFVGRYNGGTSVSTIESPYAEVIYFCQPMVVQPPDLQSTGTTLHALYRRQLLVRPYVGLPPFQGNNNRVTGALPALYSDYDISLRTVGSGLFTPNTLGDLTKRENRFLHNPNPNAGGSVTGPAFPFDIGGALNNNGYLDAQFTGDRQGEDLILDNVLAFDIKVFDPSSGSAGGTYVDLGSSGTGNPSPLAGTGFPPTADVFRSRGVRASNASQNDVLTTSTYATYDTFSSHYEANGLDEDGDGNIDEGTNGRDDNTNGVIDEPQEAETSPPYPYPLRGIEIRIRCYEPSSRQVRQVTIHHTFVPL